VPVSRAWSEAGLSGHDVLSSLTAGVLLVAADGRVSYANPAAAEILRRPLELLVGKPVAESIAPLELLLHQVGSTGRGAELAVERGDGTQVVVGYSVSAPNLGGARSLLFQPLHEVLVLRQERDRLLQMAALGDALPSILHELRNPLAAVTGALEVLIEDCDPALHKDLHAILWEVRRMNLSLQGVGGLVRPMHAKHHVAVDLAVSEACRILEPTAAKHGVRLSAEVPSLPLLPLDWGVVSGVVFNLAKNAIDACEHGGNVWVRATLEPDDCFAIEVSDDGVGMSSEVLSRCRELFYTQKPTGSGIGLALCQRMAEAAGGALSIVSAPGEGTRVRLSVPLHGDIGTGTMRGFDPSTAACTRTVPARATDR
jgi:signal transduction histidine kinase